jgi:hypothetical protein
MGSPSGQQQFPRPWPSRRWAQTLLIVLVAVATAYLISNHWLHILDALPYLGVVLMMGMHLFMHGGHTGAVSQRGSEGDGHVH